MRTMKKFIRTLIFCCLPVSALAQTHTNTVTGRVTDEQNLPLPFANVVLLSLPDSAFVSGVVSGEDGTFSLANPKGAELLRVSSVGYAPIYKRCKAGDVGTLQMRPDAQVLGEVVVKADLPVTRLKDDALETHVQGTVLSKAGTAEDVLARIPGLQRKQDGFEVLGKGAPLIYINGRKMRDASELDQLSSEDIRSVEVVQNPGARYDATVSAVVRIRTVKRQGEGFGISLRSTYDQSQNADFVEQADVNYRHNSLDVFGMIRFDKTADFSDDQMRQITYADTLWTQNIYQRADEETRRLSGRIGFNYDFNDRHSVGMRYDVSKTLREPSDAIFDSEVQVDGVPYDVLNSVYSSEIEARPTHQLNAYYAGQLGKGQLEWDADYYASHTTDNSLTQEDSQDHDDRTVTAINEVNNQLAATKASFTHPLWGGSFSVGGEYTYTDRHDDYINPEGYVRTSYSRIREQNLAGFVQYNHSLPFGQATAGVRYEHVDFDYYESGEYIPGQSRTYDNVFPNVSLSGQVGKVQFQLGYAAKTQRPSYSQLRSNVTYANRFTWQTGNPLLKPGITHDVTLSGVWRFFQAMISYKVMRDRILYWGEQVEGQSSVTLINYVNHDRLPQLSAMLSASPTIGLWSPNFMLYLQKQWLTLNAAGQRHTFGNPIFIGHWNNTFSLPAGFLFTVDFVYQSRGDAQNITLFRSVSQLGVSLRKSFLNNALSVELRGKDLLWSKQASRLYIANTQLDDLGQYDTRSFNLTVRYRFNVAKSKYRGTGAGQEAKSRF